MSFWNSRSGVAIDGSDENSFVKNFSIIPDGTTAKAQIKRFELIEKNNQLTGEPDVYYQINWRIIDGEFKNREVGQKIKCFYGKPEAIDRALNMLKRVFDLCNFKPNHSNAPTAQDIMACNNKILGIKIREWQQPKKDGSGFAEGNFVAEVHQITDKFVCETGEKLPMPEMRSAQVDSAFSRNEKNFSSYADDQIPF